MSRPWMPLYVADYIADTGHLSTLEHGAYLLLIMHYWQKGGLPPDDAKLARIARLSNQEWEEIKGTILELFGDGLTHSRIDRELEKAGSIIEAKSTAGARGADSRWGARDGREAKEKRSQRLADARQKGTHTPDEWLALLGIFGACVKCGAANESLVGGKCVKDHIVPIYQGGSDAIDNIQPLCRNCNSAKGAETIDYRGSRVINWRECLANALQKAGRTPGPSQLPSQLPSRSSDEELGEKEKPRGSAGAPSDYAFVGKVIRLSEKDMAKWAKAYHAVPDLLAELTLADTYYAENPLADGKWFFPVSQWLKREHDKQIQRGNAEREAEDRIYRGVL